MKTALGMIRAVNRNMKFRRRVAVNHNHTSVLNFKVSHISNIFKLAMKAHSVESPHACTFHYVLNTGV